MITNIITADAADAEIPKLGRISENAKTILSRLTTAKIQIATRKTSPSPALSIYADDEKNLFNSFSVKARNTLFDFIYLPLYSALNWLASSLRSSAVSSTS